MFRIRSAIRVVDTARHLATSQRNSAIIGGWRCFSSKDVVEQGEDGEEEDAVTIVQRKRDELSKKGPHLVWESPEQLPAAPLPEDPAELQVLDEADAPARTKADGSDRMVVIKQERANVKQTPLNDEKKWRISFVDDGIIAERWQNPLMGWNSSADPYQAEPKLLFDNAMDAVYFAKKRGWKYLVREPLMRRIRSDGQQYQDNFLPQDIVAKVQKERTQCAQWQRSSAATSHYFRPLKYHGTGTVGQYGPNPKQETAPHVEGVYKLR